MNHETLFIICNSKRLTASHTWINILHTITKNKKWYCSKTFNLLISLELFLSTLQVCWEQEETSYHFLVRCPATMLARTPVFLSHLMWRYV